MCETLLVSLSGSKCEIQSCYIYNGKTSGRDNARVPYGPPACSPLMECLNEMEKWGIRKASSYAWLFPSIYSSLIGNGYTELIMHCATWSNPFASLDIMYTFLHPKCLCENWPLGALRRLRQHTPRNMRARSDVESALWVRDCDWKQLKGRHGALIWTHMHIRTRINLMCPGDTSAHKTFASDHFFPSVSLSL